MTAQDTVVEQAPEGTAGTGVMDMPATVGTGVTVVAAPVLMEAPVECAPVRPVVHIDRGQPPAGYGARETAALAIIGGLPPVTRVLGARGMTTAGFVDTDNHLAPSCTAILSRGVHPALLAGSWGRTVMVWKIEVPQTYIREHTQMRLIGLMPYCLNALQESMRLRCSVPADHPVSPEDQAVIDAGLLLGDEDAITDLTARPYELGQDSRVQFYYADGSLFVLLDAQGPVQTKWYLDALTMEARSALTNHADIEYAWTVRSTARLSWFEPGSRVDNLLAAQDALYTHVRKRMLDVAGVILARFAECPQQLVSEATYGKLLQVPGDVPTYWHCNESAELRSSTTILCAPTVEGPLLSVSSAGIANPVFIGRRATPLKDRRYGGDPESQEITAFMLLGNRVSDCVTDPVIVDAATPRPAAVAVAAEPFLIQLLATDVLPDGLAVGGRYGL